MFTKFKAGSARFSISATGKMVAVAGDFSNWQPIRMKKSGASYSVEVKLPKGSHQYKFIVDGRWMEDPDNNIRVSDPFGGMNSVAQL